jgi:hypothetical protein
MKIQYFITTDTGCIFHLFVSVDTVFARVYATPKFSGQEFGNDSNLYISHTRYYLCGVKYLHLHLNLQHFGCN